MCRYLSLVLVVVLAACSTSEVRLSESKAVPPDRTFSGPLLQAGNGKQAISIIRDGGFYDGGGYVVVWVDGDRVAQLNPSESVTVYLDPGKHMLTAGIRFLGTENMGPTRPIRVPGNGTVYRVTSSTGGMTIQPGRE